MKLPSYQFYPGDWMKDPNLRRCSPAARGVWIDMLCLMFECEERGVLSSGGASWSDEEIAAAITGDTTTILSCITELLLKGVAHRNQSGAIYSKRMVRDEQARKQNAEYQRDYYQQQKGTLKQENGNGKKKPHADSRKIQDKPHVPSSHTPSSSTSSSSSSTHSPPATNGHKAENGVCVESPSEFTFDQICEYLEAHPKGIDSIEAVAGAALKDGRLDKRIRKWHAKQTCETPPAESPPQEIVSDAEMEALVRDCVSSGMRSVIETLVRDIKSRGGPQKDWEREAVAAIESSDNGRRTSDSRDSLTARA